jgi:hypothetical protein
MKKRPGLVNVVVVVVGQRQDVSDLSYHFRGLIPGEVLAPTGS